MKYILLCLLIFSGPTIVSGNTNQSIDSLIPMDENIRYGKLKNGFTYYIKKVKDSRRRTEIKLVVKAGFANERPNQKQAAHLLEHLVASGTNGYADIKEYLRSYGIVFGRDINAFTDNNSTLYSTSLPAGNQDLLMKCIDISFERCTKPLLDSASFERERSAVLNEIDYGRDLDSAASHLVNAVLSLQRNPVIAFYNEWYKPDKLALIIMGDVDADQIETEVKRIFKNIEPRDSTGNKYINLPSLPSLTDKFQLDLSYDQPSVDVAFPTRPNFVRSFADFNRKISIDLFNELVSDRFMRHSKDQDGRLLSIRYQRNYLQAEGSPDALIWRIQFPQNSRQENVREIIGGFSKLERQIVLFGFTNDEITRAKKRIHAKEVTDEEPDKVSYSCVLHFLTEQSIPSLKLKRNLVTSFLDTVSNRHLIKEYLSWTSTIDTQIVVKGNPDSQKILPDRTLINNLRLAVINSTIKPIIEDTRKVGQLFSEEEIHILKNARTKYKKELINDQKAVLLKFPNGIKVILKPFNVSGSKSDKILMECTKPGGAFQLDSEKYFLALICAQIVKSSGIGDLSGKDLEDLSNRDNTEIFPIMGDHYRGFKGESSFEGVETMMQIIKQYLERPQVDSLYIQQNIELLIQSFKKGIDVTDETLFPPFKPDTKKLSDSIIAELYKVKTDDVRRMYKMFFSDLKGFTFVFTGNFNPDHMIQVVTQYLGTVKLNEVNSLYIKKNRTNQYQDSSYAFEMQKKESSGSSVRLFIIKKIDDSGLNGFWERIILKNILYNLVYDRLRTQMKSVYRVSVVETDLFDGWYRFEVYFESSFGTSSDTLARAVWEQIDQLCKYKIDKSVLQGVVNSFLFQLAGDAGHGFWQKLFFDMIMNDVEMRDIENLKNSVQQLSEKDVINIANKWLKISEIVRVSD